jgi:DNA-binding protein YbaB
MNPFKMLGALKDMGRMQEEMRATAERLAAERFSAGDGAVEAEVTGSQLVVAVRIAPEARHADDLEARVAAAVNAALQLAKQRTAEVMQKQMQERFGDLGGMDSMLKGFLPGT